MVPEEKGGWLSTVVAWGQVRRGRKHGDISGEWEPDATWLPDLCGVLSRKQREAEGGLEWEDACWTSILERLLCQK